jgi:hypothetical protein
MAAIAGKPSAGRAVVEAFLTAKGDTLYAILPWWPSRPVVLKDIRPSAQTIVTMLGWAGPLKWTPVEGGIAVEVPPLSADELPCEYAYPLKLTHVEGEQPRVGTAVRGAMAGGSPVVRMRRGFGSRCVACFLGQVVQCWCGNATGISEIHGRDRAPANRDKWSMNNPNVMVTWVQTSQMCCRRGLWRMLFAFLALACPLTARAAEQAAAPSSAGPKLHICPLDLTEVHSITPLGNLNPRGGHVFPTDHIYLDYGGREGLPVRAPASGRVFAIRGQIRDDFKIEVQVNDRFSYYVAHVLPVKGLSVGSTVESGEIIAHTSGRSMLDLGCVDAHVMLKGFVNPDRYPASTRHCVSPLKLYDDPLRSQLYSKVMRDGADKDGRIDYDVVGRLVGNWFLEGLSAAESSRGAPQIWAKQLAFAYDVRRPQARRVSIGGTIAPAGLYELSAVSPDPVEIDIKSGLVKFVLTIPESQETVPPRRKATSVTGILLVQMLTPNRVKVEFSRGRKTEEITGFTESARVYER